MSRNIRRSNTTNDSTTNDSTTNDSTTNDSTTNVPGISFIYTDNFNRITDLSTENYPIWRSNLLYLLDINNLIDYVTTEKVKKIKKNKISNIDDFIVEKLDKSVAYPKSTDPLDIRNDNITKWVIINSLGNETRKIIENRGKTAFEI